MWNCIILIFRIHMAKTQLPKLHSDFSVDCVIFGFDEGELKVLLVERNEPPFKEWKAIPGNLVYDVEDIDEAAARVLYELTGLKNIFLETGLMIIFIVCCTYVKYNVVE